MWCVDLLFSRSCRARGYSDGGVLGLVVAASLEANIRTVKVQGAHSDQITLFRQNPSGQGYC